MKKILKKISAFVLALTLISGGTTIAKNIDPKFENAIVASAIHPVSSWTTRNGFSFFSANLWLKDGSIKYFSHGDRYTAYKYEVLWGMWQGKSINTCMIRKYSLYLDSDGVSRWRYISSEYYDCNYFYNIDWA